MRTPLIEVCAVILNNRNTMIRAINIDWLEVYCLEPTNEPHTAKWFEDNGYKVKAREYGTPVYKEMFTIYQDEKEWIEIRRNPYSRKGEGGFLDPLSTHIKLCNEFCYTDSPIDELRAFLLACNYTFKSISRIDICMDFNEFDGGIQVKPFIQDYIKGKYSKLNQSKVNLHGEDFWRFREWNSLKWGSPSSPFSTKLYNKSKELREVKDKDYIRQCWLDAGLDLSRNVWRIEFSTSSQAQTRKSKEDKRAFKLHLLMFDDRSKLLMRFFELYEKYFDFREVITTVDENGKVRCKRKDRCPRLELIKYNHDDIVYTPSRNVSVKKRPERTYKILINKLEKLVNEKGTEREYKDAFRILIMYLIYKMRFEIREVRIEAEEEIFKLRGYSFYLSQMDDKIRKENLEAREKELMLRLMTKYGYCIGGETDCPF